MKRSALLGFFLAAAFAATANAQERRRMRPIIFGPSPLVEVGKGVLCGLAARDGNPCVEPPRQEADASSPFFAGVGIKLMLFGGEGHDVYLGCLSCNFTHRESIFNVTGPFGATTGNATLMNRDGPFGRDFGPYSPCSPYAQWPPVMVDQTGKFWGYLTISTTKPGRNASESVLVWLRTFCT